VTGPAGDGKGSLADAVQAGLAGVGAATLSVGARRLISAYRSGAVPDAPVVASRSEAAAYAAYRMPATVAATAAALRQMRLSLPDWQPGTVLDLGAGTGGTAWAAAGELPGLRKLTLLEQSLEAIRLGKSILAQSATPALRTATWSQWRLPADQPAESLPQADLACAAYVLGELTQPQRANLVDLAWRAAPAVLLVEPGTPAGHRRILAARAALLAAGFHVVAPCPHESCCPLAAAGDWCHFSARVQRSSIHRRAKGAELGYEDEKFSYVAAIRVGTGAADLPPSRIVRRPQQRKGLVTLEVCAADGSSQRELVSKSKGEAYKLARKASWGDRWND
jgi:ribosomal protein RSM22 (predicted rRNA methylase)